MGYITELKSKSKRTRYKAVINICKKSDGIEYFDTQTFSTKVLAKAWLKREEDRLEKNPEHLSTQKIGKSDQGEFRFDGRDYFVVTF